MPYTRPNAYTTATAINAEEVRENHETLRSFVNRGIRQADIDGAIIDWTHVLAGEYASVTKDHRFSTGWHYSQFYDSEESHQSAVGSSMKTMAITSPLYIPIIGKRVRATVSDAVALVTAYLQVVPNFDGYVEDAAGSADLAYLYVDGVQVAVSESPFFAGNENGSIIGSDAGGSMSSRLRVATIHTLVDGLSEGMHDIEVRIDPWHTFSAIRARSLSVEVFEV